MKNRLLGLTSKLNHKVLRNSAIYTISEIINKLVPFLLLPVLTMYLTPSDYGIVATYTAYFGILVVFIQLSLSGAINVNFFKINKEQLKIYIANTFVILLVSTSVVLLFILIFLETLSLKLNLTSFWLIAAVFSVLFQAFTITNLTLWMAEQSAKEYAIYQIALMILNTLMALTCVVFLKLGWEGQLIGQLVSITSFALLSFIFILKRKYLKCTLDKNYIKDALKFGIPLIPHSLSG